MKQSLSRRNHRSTVHALRYSCAVEQPTNNRKQIIIVDNYDNLITGTIHSLLLTMTFLPSRT